MLEKLAKTMAVINELKKLPPEERAWLLQVTKDFAREQREHYERLFSQTSPTRQLEVLQRIETVKIAERLLGSIRLRL